MSRNRGRTNCGYCGNQQLVRSIPDEKPRHPRQKEVHIYFEEYRNRLFLTLHCPICGMRYLGWCQDKDLWQTDPWSDTSYYYSFDDEPCDEDVPVFEVTVATVYRLKQVDVSKDFDRYSGNRHEVWIDHELVGAHGEDIDYSKASTHDQIAQHIREAIEGMKP